MSDERIAILGAGPIGLEAALYALERGYEVDVYERAEPGAHVARWGHVRLFSPWRMNRSPWGERRLQQAGVELAAPERCPTGRAYRQDYLLALAERAPLADRIQRHTRVEGVSRRHAFKGEYIGQERRDEAPFVLLLDGEEGQRYAEADIVVDATGVYGQPRHMGIGGLPALGERRAELLVERHIPDPLGADRPVYASQTTLLVGNGYSAVTSARLMHGLHDEAPDTRLVWLLPDDDRPYPPIPDDPLSARLELAEFGNRAACGEVDGIEPVFGHLHRLAPADEGLSADIEQVTGTRSLIIDRVIGNVGYRPDTSLYRELQIHQCYATEGLMDLSAHLLAQRGETGGDCLQQTSGGFETLTSPEPNFFVLGSKSYGRNSDFLLRLGYAQVEELFEGLR